MPQQDHLSGPVSRPHDPHSVGVTPRHNAHFDQPLTLRSGAILPSFTLAYETYGTLNAERSNAISAGIWAGFLSGR